MCVTSMLPVPNAPSPGSPRPGQGPYAWPPTGPWPCPVQGGCAFPGLELGVKCCQPGAGHRSLELCPPCPSAGPAVVGRGRALAPWLWALPTGAGVWVCETGPVRSFEPGSLAHFARKHGVPSGTVLVPNDRRVASPGPVTVGTGGGVGQGAKRGFEPSTWPKAKARRGEGGACWSCWGLGAGGEHQKALYSAASDCAHRLRVPADTPSDRARGAARCPQPCPRLSHGRVPPPPAVPAPSFFHPRHLRVPR